MATYEFTREKVGDVYNVDNPYCVDVESNPVPLAKELKADAALPSKLELECHEGNCTVTFDVILDPAQETALSDIIAAHKAHTAG